MERICGCIGFRTVHRGGDTVPDALWPDKVGVLPSLMFAFCTSQAGWAWLPACECSFTASNARNTFWLHAHWVQTTRRLITKHIYPNAIGTIITAAVLTIPGVIFTESILSYLNIVNFETSSLTSIGTMLANGQGIS